MTSIGECQPVPDSAAPDSPAAPQRKGRLLIVDDEEGPRQSLRVIFKDDYEVVMANDGPSAIVAAQEQRVDVAVLDIRMTGMSGIEVLERLKYVDPGIEVVMMTAFETTDTMRQALRLRCYRLLDLGMTPGARLFPEMRNFFADPRAYRVRGTLIALRREQAAQIWVRAL